MYYQLLHSIIYFLEMSDSLHNHYHISLHSAFYCQANFPKANNYHAEAPFVNLK